MSQKLAELPYRVIGFECTRCPRHGHYRKETLVELFGSDELLPYVLPRIAKCHRNGKGCGIRWDGLRLHQVLSPARPEHASSNVWRMRGPANRRPDASAR